MGTAEPGIAPAAVLSRYHQDQEHSAMVQALSRVVAGEPEPMAYSPSPLMGASASSGRLREEVLQCYQGGSHQSVGGFVVGEASSNVNISGDFTFCFVLSIMKKRFIL